MSRPLETYRCESTKPPVSPFRNSHHSRHLFMDLCKKGEVEMGGIGDLHAPVTLPRCPLVWGRHPLVSTLGCSHQKLAGWRMMRPQGLVPQVLSAAPWEGGRQSWCVGLEVWRPESGWVREQRGAAPSPSSGCCWEGCRGSLVSGGEQGVCLSWTSS